MSTMSELFGVQVDALAAAQTASTADPSPAMATTEATLQPVDSWRAILDPKGSAVFWLAVAAVLGLAMVSGQLKVSAALNARGGK